MSDAEWIMKQQLEIKDKEIERLRSIVDEAKSLHYGTDLFTSCAAGEADRLIALIESEAINE